MLTHYDDEDDEDEAMKTLKTTKTTTKHGISEMIVVGGQVVTDCKCPPWPLFIQTLVNLISRSRLPLAKINK